VVKARHGGRPRGGRAAAGDPLAVGRGGPGGRAHADAAAVRGGVVDARAGPVVPTPTIGNNCMGTTLRITRKGAIRCMMTPYECPLRRFVGFAVVRKWHVIANCKTQDRSQ